MNQIVDLLVQGKHMCCGCGTCALVCPVRAIKMVPGELGCLYPEVDADKCIGCGLCERNCAYRTSREEDKMVPLAFAAAAKDQAMLQNSASGGVFAALARKIIEVGGVVCGCSMEMEEGKLVPMHICVETYEKLEKLQGSKYVQSMLGNVFAEIRGFLKAGRVVLFSGTPCQVDSLKCYLQDEDTRNLYTIDIICHGVPSAKLFRDYLDRLEKKGAVCEFRFRDKTLGWGLNASYTVRKQKGKHRKKLLSPGISSYYTYFLESEIYRESCYSCRYANTNRVGDLTIGDYWGIEQEHPEYLAENGGLFNTSRGISAILVNTPKGREFLKEYGIDLSLAKSDPRRISRWNSQLRNPSNFSNVRMELMQSYQADGYDGIEAKFKKELGIRYYVRKLRNLNQNIKLRF